jgi:hypothetical protein
MLLSTTLNNVLIFIYLLNLLIDGDLTNKWLNRLRATANTNEGREQLGQISAILEFYSKQSANHGLQVSKVKYLKTKLGNQMGRMAKSNSHIRSCRKDLTKIRKLHEG